MSTSGYQVLTGSGSILESSLHPGEETFVDRGDLVATNLSQTPEQVLFFEFQLGGDVDADHGEQISTTSPVEMGHALALQAEHLAVFGTAGDLQFLGPIECFQFDRRAENRLGQLYPQFSNEVVLSTFEDLVGLDPQSHIEVSSRATPTTDCSPARKLQGGTVVNTRRHVNGVGPFLDQATGS